MRYFDAGTSVMQDSCAQKLKEYGNKNILDYRTSLASPQNSCHNDLYFENPNLRCKNGYGITDAETIDCDTRLRYEDPRNIRGPDSQQLFPRVFKAVPDLSSGTFVPDIESKLLHGHDTFVDHGCKTLTEVDFERYTGMNDCVEKLVVDGFNASLENHTRTGIPTRDTKCYRYDERKKMKPEDLIQKKFKK